MTMLIMSTSSSDIEVGSSDLNNSRTTKLHPKLSIERWHSAIASSGANFRYVSTLLLVLLAIICVTILLLTTQDLKNNLRLCLKPECVTAAADLLKNMDLNADPCDDFFQYACGGWQKIHSIPEDESRIDTFSVMRNELMDILRSNALLEVPINQSDGSAVKKAKILYLSCINETEIERRKESPLIKLLEDEFGGWPLIDTKWNQSINKFDSISIMGKLRQYNNEIIIGHNVGPNEYNASTFSIKLYPATLGLSSVDFYKNISGRQIQAYIKLITQITTILSKSNETLAEDITNLIDFEIKLANITRPFEKMGGALYQRLTIKKLSKLIPTINWKRYFKYAIPVHVNETEMIGVYGLDYFMDIADLIDTTPKRITINYLLWRFVMNRVNNLDNRFEKIQHEFYRELYGTKMQPLRWKKCVDYVNNNMGIAVSALYVKSHFTEESKTKAEEMIRNIRNIFFEILDEISWMDNETRADAKTKATMMKQHIGFPENMFNTSLLDAEYEFLQFDINKYFENVVGFLKNSTKKSQLKLYSEDDGEKWTIVPSVVNAHYHRYKNLMSFPAAVLQPPLYHPNYPKSLNYGAIGSIIGHELTHGFDSNGRHHDQYGNQRLWWHPNTIDRFIAKSQCMIKQYGNYSLPTVEEDVKVNGALTLSENIADNGGIKQSFRAYKKWQLKNTSEDPLPGLNLNTFQLFFLKFAQNWCQLLTPEGTLSAVRSWKHSPGKYRVIGTLSNSKDFAEAYNCPIGSRMNPIEKCEVW